MWPPFGPFWYEKYLNCGQKLPIQTTHQTFLESRHPEVTKNPSYVLSPEWSQKKVSAPGLQLLGANWSQNEKCSEFIEIWPNRFLKYADLNFDEKYDFC